jgi:4-diphosphocytidyl-2-C-methyl-D-erythritol kinase
LYNIVENDKGGGKMTVIERANAKINLFLDVTARREDGFHNIKSVMHSVSLCDILTVTAEKGDATEIVITTDVLGLSTGNDNLIYRAAVKYLEYFGIKAAVKINLEKHIPIGAGLGGGSSDAAATLRGMNRIFGLGSLDQLLIMAAELGSDVPFCLVGGCTVCTGRGERMEKIDSPFYHLVIAIGGERVSTPKAYAALDLKYSDFASDAYMPNENIDEFYNIFESVTEMDEICRIKELMTKNGAEHTLMSGSGPSVFGVFKNREACEAACRELKKSGFDAHVATSEGGNI